MTVSSTTTKAQYSGNGVTTVFAVPFYFLLNADLLVILRSAAGVETTQLLGTNYTVTGAGNEAGGSVTMIVAPASGTTLTILRNAPATQDTDLLPNDRLPAESLETALDKLTMLVQQLDEESARSIKFAATDASTSTTLPTSSQRANKFLSFDNNGNPIVTGSTDTYTVGVETKIATQGQTVFTLLTISYTPGINNLSVFVDGVNQVGGSAYTETSSTSVTFSQGLHAGAIVKFSTVRTLSSSTIDSAAVPYLPAGTGAVLTNVQAKLRQTISVKDFGAVGDGVTDDTAALQAALNAADNKELDFDSGTYLIAKGAGSYVLTAPANIRLIGVPGKTIIKLSSAATDCYMLGRSAASTYFECNGITFDGNKSAINTINVSALYFPEATTVISRNNTYKDLNDVSPNPGAVIYSKAIYVSNSVLAEYAESSNDIWLGCEGYPFQTYYTAQNLVQNGYASNLLVSFTDINGQTIPNNVYAKTKISGNTITCSGSFRVGYSVLSLMGNEIECTGNKIDGGSVQIVVHDGTTDTLFNYVISGNLLSRSAGSGIVVNQSSGTSAINGNVVVANNTIYQAATDSIVIVGLNYSGGTTTPRTNTSVVGNVIYDYLTSNPNPGSTVSSIRLLGTVNCSVVGNTIIGPRWAGITCHYDGRNITISGNVIADHQGRTTTAPEHGAPIFIGAGNATAYLGNINVIGNTIRNYCSTVSPATTSARSGGIVVNEANAQDITIRGNRIMTGNAAGISLYNCVNVTAKDNEISGVVAPATALNTSSGIGAGCELAYAVSGPTYAATGSRPTLQSTQAGYSMWDSTLNKPIWWNGSVWKDASNATV